MEIAAATVGTLVSKLVGLLQDEYKLMIKGFRNEIIILYGKLQMLEAVLLDASETGQHRRADDYSRLRELSYDIEDSVDEFMIRRARRGPPPCSTPLGVTVLFYKIKDLLAEIRARERIAKQIENLKFKVDEISERHATRPKNISSSAPVPAVLSEGRTVHRPIEDPPHSRALSSVLKADASSLLVGVDGPRDELISMLQLMEEKDEPESAARLKVVSIFGMGGLGKTTLAKEVYHEIQGSFDCRAWVPVSRNPNMENVLMGILRQVEDPHSNAAAGGDGKRELIRRIKRSLEGKSYLLVLDDIWTTRTWEVIKSALPLDSCGSRVITTTRMKAVATSCSSDWNDNIYQVIPLSSKDSWTLFRRRIISSMGSFPSHFIDVSDKILKRCSGVPLAIITMSGLLAHKPIQEDVCRYISAIPEGKEGIRNILLLSYYDLPRHLKACFLYLSIFPEYYPINCDHIIRCWIAEGLILENHKRTPEEAGESYLNELINRCMIKPVRDSYDGKPESFLIHSMILELIKSKSSKDNIVNVLNNEEPLSVLHGKIRLLSIVNINDDHDIPASVDISHIRSLHIFGGVGMKLALKHLSFLRVLDLEGCKDFKNNSIEENPGLLFLKYLSIRDTSISEKPDQSKQRVQRSQLSGSCYLNRIPEWFKSLQRIEYICIDIMEVKDKDLQLLSVLPLLKHLSLSSKTMPTKMLVIKSSGFPILKEFHLHSVRADLTFEPQAMQKLEILLLSVHVLPGKTYDSISISQFMCLKKITIRIIGEGSGASQLLEAIKKASDEHPNHPVASIIALGDLNDYAAKEENERRKRWN